LLRYSYAKARWDHNPDDKCQGFFMPHIFIREPFRQARNPNIERQGYLFKIGSLD